ncbi:MAG TPA: trypsin-like serine protease [Usitatibacter sp.]|nr:trypsin-like serine protease [Usitatibacter sp.]
MNRFVRFAAVAALAVPLSVPALLIRPDRDDAEYLEMATKYVSAVPIDVPGGGEGVLIGAQWILTSARVGATLKAMKSPPVIKVGTRGLKVDGVYVHPVWRPGSNSSDIALVHLAGAAKIEPTPLYRNDDEAGKGVVIVGNGETGKLGDKVLRQDHKARAGINTIDRLSPKVFGMTVKSGDEASDLQAAFTTSESGAPAYFQNEAKELFVIGIASSSKDENSDGLVNAGDTQVFVRVSAYVPWIEETIEKAAKDEVNKLLDGSKSS